MKKLIALVCAVMMIVSVFASMTVSAAVEGVEVKLDFVKFEPMNATYDYAYVDVYMSIPDTLSPWTLAPNDDPFADATYNGNVLQSIGVEITIPNGIKVMAADVLTPSYLSATNNATSVNGGNVKLVYTPSSMSDYTTYYSGAFGGKVATLKLLAVDWTDGYDIDVADAAIWRLVFDNSAKGTPVPYVMDDFNITNATVKAEPVIEYEEVVNAVDADVTTLSDGTYTWENIAIYKATFDLDNIVAEKGYGIKAGDYSYGAAVKGTGTVDYVLAFYGIADTDDLAVSEYYTVVKK